jgi:molybdenum cofactor biosynthesis protein B
MSYREHVNDASSIVARCAIITLSDTRTPDTDTSGQAIRRLLEADGHSVSSYRLILDDADQLRGALDELLPDDATDAILSTGGTGISARDATVDVIEEMLDAPLPGFGELFRMLSFEEIGSGAMMSRAIAGIARGKPVFAMPGSSKAVELALTRLILPELRHLLHELRKHQKG